MFSAKDCCDFHEMPFQVLEDREAQESLECARELL